MANNSRFYGNDPKIGIGIVEDIKDPLKAGRVRVRIYGIHSPFASELPTTDLPWSQVMMPVTSASISGEGDTPQLLVGSQVFGIFLDNSSFQQFMVCGTMLGFSGQTTIQTSLDTPKMDDNNIALPERLVGDSNAEKAFHFFIQYGGYTEDQAAGIVGNLAYESTVNLNTSQTGGLIKWKDKRLTSLKEYAFELGRLWTDLFVQLSFMLSELQGQYVYVAKKMVNTFQPSTSAEIFAKDYLGKTDLTERKKLANQAKAAFGSTAGGDYGNFTPSTINRAEYAKGEIVETSEELLNIFKSAKKKRQITELIVHDTQTYEDEQVTVFDIDKTHASFGGVQYHFLIQRNGNIQIGKDISLPDTSISNTTVDKIATTVSEAGKAFIKQEETGGRPVPLIAYEDGDGYSIGYGHHDSSISEGDVITLAQAENYFNEDIVEVETALNSALNGTPINQNEFDAYASLAYNIGTGAFSSSTTLRRFKEGKKQEAADAILLFKFATIGGEREAYLLPRRKRERTLFLTPVSDAQKRTITRLNNSVGIAIAGGLVGSAIERGIQTGATYKDKQYESFDFFVNNFLKIWPNSNILGHDDIDDLSGDPYFDVPSYAESKFDHKNKEDAPNNPVIPGDQVKITSPSVSSDIISEPTSTTKVTLSEADDTSSVSVVESTGTSTVARPGFLLDLTPYLLSSNFTTQLKANSIRKLIDVYDIAPSNGDVLTWVAANNRYEPQAASGGGSGFAYTDTTATSTTADYLPFYDSDDANSRKKTTIANLISDNAIATATSSTAFTNKTGNISQWTNDSGYITATLTQEQVEDYVGGMVGGASVQTGITVTYDDTNGELDFVVNGLTTTQFTSANISQWTNDSGYLDSSDIGVNVQAYDADLSTWAGISPSANVQSFVSAADYSAMRTLLNVEDGATADQSAAEILTLLLTVDGSGSGLDADLLDGNNSAAFALVGSSNTFTANQTFTTSSAQTSTFFGGAVNFPVFNYLNSNSGYNRGIMYRSGTSNRWLVYATSTAESGSNAGTNLAIARYNDAGTFVDTPIIITRSSGDVSFGSGVIVGSPTGGSKGVGTINATAVYDDNTLLTDYVFDVYLDGEISDEDFNNKRALEFNSSMLDMDTYISTWKKERSLPSMPSRNQWREHLNPSLGEMIQRLWETVELQAVHISQLNDKINDLNKVTGKNK